MTDKHEHLDEGTIHAWLDGALSPDESARVEAQAGACTECAALVAEARGLVAASSRILSSLDTIPGGVIPGAGVGVDQLAALRARRSATTRRWWSGRRIVAAASLVFVAGVSSVVWRFAGTDAVTSPTEQTVDAVQPFADSAVPVVTAPPAPATPAAKARNEARAEAPPQLREPAPMRLTAANVSDSTSDMKSDLKKVAATGMALPRSADVAANEVRRLDSAIGSGRQAILDSMAKRDIAERPAFEKQQVQLQGGAPSQQALQQTAQARARAAAAPPAFAAGARLGPVVTTGVGAAAAAMEPMARCYQLRLATPPARSRILADSVQLLNETLPELTDPAWYRAKAVGFADTALVWRSVDSTTVELRSRVASTPLLVRFNTAPSSLPLPDVGREPGVRAVLAGRILCP